MREWAFPFKISRVTAGTAINNFMESKPCHGLLSVILLFAIVSLVCGPVNAQTRSRIVGTITDSQTGEGLLGANVIVKGTYLGAASDMDGKYFIINVPVGTYELQVSMIGYETQLIKGVVVSVDRISTVDVKLHATTIQGKEIVVTAPRDNLHKEVSSTNMVISADQIKETSGIREINAFLEKLPGVSLQNGFLTIRGGSADQTGTMINGFAYDNAAVGNAETSVPLSAIDQVSLFSGGYNAEYGNFRSGLINITTKSGTSDGYHGTFSFSRDDSHMRRFGDAFNSTSNPVLTPYLDPNVAFVGTATAWANDTYKQQQYDVFPGWISVANQTNSNKTPAQQATPMQLYLLSCWMHTAVPDYKSLANLPGSIKEQIGYYQVSSADQKEFADHSLREDLADWNFDGGFGGPVPFIGKALGNATFYISNNSSEQHYVIPVTLNSQKSYTTLGTIKATPLKSLTVTYNALWKREIGVSPARPAFGDAPDATDAGGFMQINNVADVYNSAKGDQTVGNSMYWYDAAFFPILDQTTLLNGIQINNVLNNRTFWELNVSYLTIGDHTPTGDNRDSTTLMQIGPFLVNEMPYGKLQFSTLNNYGYTPSLGYDGLPSVPRRFRSKEGDLNDNSQIHQLSVRANISSQLNDHHFIKGGIEYNYIDINHNYWEKWNTNAYNTYEYNYHRWPSQTGLYVQDQITYEEMIANVGVRADYYYGGGGKWPTGDPYNFGMFSPQAIPGGDTLFQILSSGQSYIWNVWQQYDKQHPGFLQPIKNYFTVSPRIGLSFPVTTNSKFYFNYGHFRSNPPYYTMYQFSFRETKNGLYQMSNPNLEPPKTISYELGVSYNFLPSYTASVSGYYKDVTGEPGTVNYTNAAGTLTYKGLASNQFEDIEGLEVNLTKSDNSWITGWINFDYMLKKTGQTGYKYIREIVTNAQGDLYSDQVSRLLPQPTINAEVNFRTPENFGPKIGGNNFLGNWNISIFATYKAGSFFTWNPLNDPFLNNNLEWPDYYMVNLKISKTINVGITNVSLYLDIDNIFNFKVNDMSDGYAFADNTDKGTDFSNYMASLHLPMYNSSSFDQLRSQNPGMYVSGNDKVGEQRSSSKQYINDPNYSSLFLFTQPRDIWFGMRVDL
jgi:outer membrane receptor for ferrienterochelin and colicin